jgi:hypothetical protein
MDISIGSYKVRLEILILIVIVFWIMFGHVLCSCCKFSMAEGMHIMKEGLTGTPGRKVVGANVISNNQDNTSTTEGFVSANNVASGPEFSMAKSPDYIMNPSTWSMPTLTYSPGTKPDAGVKAIWDRPKQPIPLPKDELFMFATTEFKPECCPNAYSSSTGCACMDVNSYAYLRERGGNNVPYSVY